MSRPAPPVVVSEAPEVSRGADTEQAESGGRDHEDSYHDSLATTPSSCGSEPRSNTALTEATEAETPPLLESGTEASGLHAELSASEIIGGTVANNNIVSQGSPAAPGTEPGGPEDVDVEEMQIVPAPDLTTRLVIGQQPRASPSTIGATASDWLSGFFAPRKQQQQQQPSPASKLRYEAFNEKTFQAHFEEQGRMMEADAARGDDAGSYYRYGGPGEGEGRGAMRGGGP